MSSSVFPVSSVRGPGSWHYAGGIWLHLPSAGPQETDPQTRWQLLPLPGSFGVQRLNLPSHHRTSINVSLVFSTLPICIQYFDCIYVLMQTPYFWPVQKWQAEDIDYGMFISCAACADVQKSCVLNMIIQYTSP